MVGIFGYFSVIFFLSKKFTGKYLSIYLRYKSINKLIINTLSLIYYELFKKTLKIQ